MEQPSHQTEPEGVEVTGRECENPLRRVQAAWRFKERINGEFDSDWILTKYEPADGVRIIAKEPLYQVDGAPALIAENARLREAMRRVTQALGDLSFECFGGIGTCRPSVETYNRTFGVLEEARAALAEQKEQP